MSHPPFNHNPHVYGMVDPAKRVVAEQGVSDEGNPTDSLVVHSDVARPADEEAAEPVTDEPTTGEPTDETPGNGEQSDEDSAPGNTAEDYEVFSKADLVAECEQRGLPVSGNKPDLVKRLLEHDAAAVPEQASGD